jgi:lipopolysaccharide export system protein LptC
LPTDTARLHKPAPSVLAWAGPVALGVMAILLATFFWQTGAIRMPESSEKDAPPAIAKPDQATAAQTTYSGFDEQNRPFAINAAAVEQSKDDKNLVFMQTVDGTFERPSGQGLKVNAPQAQYRVDTKALALEGGVTFVEPGRMTAQMERAQVDVKTLTLTSDSPVDVEMNGATIKAQSISVTENGTRIHFKGGVRARFVTKPETKGDGG